MPEFLHCRLMRALGPLALCAATTAAGAQAATARKADPLDAAAVVPAAAYESVFGRSRRADADAIPWREANDSAARIGGWRAYAREAQQPEPAPPAAAPARPETQTTPMPMPHRHGSPRKP